MVIMNNIRKPHTSSVGSPYQPKGTSVAVPEHFRRVTLNQQAIGLPHLFTAYTRREGSHIRPEPTIVPVYRIYLVAAHPNIYLVLLQLIKERFPPCPKGKIRDHACPYRL